MKGHFRFCFFSTLLLFAQFVCAASADLLSKIRAARNDDRRLELFDEYFANGIPASVPDNLNEIINLYDSLAEKSMHTRHIIRSSFVRADNYKRLGHYIPARQLFQKTIALSGKSSDRLFYCKACDAMGAMLMETGNYKEALEYDLKALDCASQLGDTAQIGSVYNNIATLYFDQKDYTSAMKYFNLALNSAKVGRNYDAIADAENNRAQVYRRLNNPDSAIQSYNQAIQIYRALKNLRLLPRPHANLAEVYADLAQKDSALLHFRTAINLLGENVDRSTYAAGIYRAFGQYMMKLGKIDSALIYLNIAAQFDERSGALRGMISSYRSMADIHAQTKNYPRAYEYLLKSYALNDSVFGSEKSRILADMEAKYQSELKEKEIAEQNALLAKQRRFAYASAIVAVVLTLLFFLFYRNAMKQRRLNKALAIAKERAEKSEKFKEQFLANMSHEIRTPMNAVLGMTNILLEKKPSTAQRDYLERIKKSADNLLVIINDVLNLSKIQAGKMDFERIAFKPAEVFELVVDTMQYKVEEKGLQLALDYSRDLPQVLLGDPTRLNEVLINLVGNAIKFTEKGKVSMVVKGSTISPGICRMHVDVVDTGIGMNAEAQTRIFESFQQAASDTTRKYGGTGLGLSITKQLIELQGGRISVQSKSGEGSRFSFEIDYQIASDDAIAAARKKTIGSSTIDKLSKLRVLVAEDNEYNRIVIVDTLELRIPGMKVDTANDGEEALEKLRAADYDLLLMDVQMPRLDGFQATTKIRNEFPSPKKDIVIIALTASVLRADVEKCVAAGMNGYCPKPFKPEQLLHVMANAFNLQDDAVDQANDEQTARDAADGNVTDLTFLKSFTAGDIAKLQKYVRMYLGKMPQHMSTMTEAIGKNDLYTVSSIAHAIKPQLNFMGMQHANALAAKIEMLSADIKNREASSDAVSELVAELKGECDKSYPELQELAGA